MVNLQSLKTPNSRIEVVKPGQYCLILPPETKKKYQLSQLDDYHALSRKNFLWTPPVYLSLTARVSHKEIQGTWGFGFWNDPFGLSLGISGGISRLPTLPEASWYFYASSQNYLSFRNGLPGNGFLAASYCSYSISPILITLASPWLILALWSQTAKILSRIFKKLIKFDSTSITVDHTQWHQYRIEWQTDQVIYSIDNHLVFKTNVSPKPPLGAVIWIDNQYASFRENDRLRFGTLPNHQSIWLEVKDIYISSVHC